MRLLTSAFGTKQTSNCRLPMSAFGGKADIGKTQTANARKTYDAVAAWRRFVSCVELLPPDQAAPLWQVVSVEAAAHIA
jgi:hypothetical protein